MPSKVLRGISISTLRFGEPGSCRFSRGYASKNFYPRPVDTMPKDKQELLAMQRQRVKMKKKTEHYSPSRVTLQILGTGARGAPRSLYVNTDHSIYLFNCGEGTQRLCHEHHLRLSKMENIFLTTATWNNTGGLPGMALTVQDSGVPSIKMHGPKGCGDLFLAIRRFVTLQEIQVSEAACKEDEPFSDQVMSVRYVPLVKPEPEVSPEPEAEVLPADNVDYYAYDVNQNGKRPWSQPPALRKAPRTEDLIQGGLVVGSMAYVCKLTPKSGSLMLDKCVDRGVTPGPLLGKLKAGEDVTLPDGTVVRSVDVCSPPDPGPVFIVLECPDEDYLESVLSNEIFAKHQATAARPEDVASCVVHFSPERIIENPRYREWMEKFGPTTRHMLINEKNQCCGSEAVHNIQHKLHLLHPTIFPFISEDGMAVDNTRADPVMATLEDHKKSEEKSESKSKAVDQANQEEPTSLISGVKTLDAFHLRPSKGFDTSSELVITPRAYIDEVFGIDGFLDCLAELQTEINARTKSIGDSSEYPKIVMLGTGSSIPNKTRNTSGILLRIDEDNSVIMDCGEGTAKQLVRFYGNTEIDKILATIKVVFVSHLHADHHLGLIGLLKQRARVTKQPVMLLAPEQMGSWLRLYNRRFEKIDDKLFLIPNKHMNLNKRTLTVADETRLQEALKGVTFTTAQVVHCPHSFGVSLSLENGLKIVYSGDCVPCDSLVKLGEGCDVLIHEATMADDLEDEARAKFHSTISQAIGVGEAMKAKFTLLTHFSQRYSKLPVLPVGEKTADLSRVGIAYDNMQISVSQLPLLPLMYPALNLMFSEFRVMLEERAMKRQLRLERETRRRDDADERKKDQVAWGQKV